MHWVGGGVKPIGTGMYSVSLCWVLPRIVPLADGCVGLGWADAAVPASQPVAESSEPLPGSQ